MAELSWVAPVAAVVFVSAGLAALVGAGVSATGVGVDSCGVDSSDSGVGVVAGCGVVVLGVAGAVATMCGEPYSATMIVSGPVPW